MISKVIKICSSKNAPAIQTSVKGENGYYWRKMRFIAMLMPDIVAKSVFHTNFIKKRGFCGVFSSIIAYFCEA
jgi:hypothetical protein